MKAASIIGFIVLVLHLGLSGQSYKSLDEFTKITSINIASPTEKIWDSISNLKILTIEKDQDFFDLGGEKSNIVIHSILLKTTQMNYIWEQLLSTDQVFIKKVPSYSFVLIPNYEKNNQNEQIEMALYVHNNTLLKHPNTTPYEYCESKFCPDKSVFPHGIICSVQVTKSHDKYILIIGIPFGDENGPIPWDIDHLYDDIVFPETVIELTSLQFKNLFRNSIN